MTNWELKERLAQLDELTLLELLDITSTELVYFLSDCIDEKEEELYEQFEDSKQDAE
jgi:hypothetical protein